MTDTDEVAAATDEWPEVAQLGAGGGTASPPDDVSPGGTGSQIGPSGPASSPPSPPVAVPASVPNDPEQPRTAPGALVCGAAECRAEIRMAPGEGDKDLPVNVGQDPAGNLVWRRSPAGAWRMHVLKKGETPDPAERRFMSHFATCPAAGKFRNRPAPSGAAALKAGGLSPELVRAHVVRDGVAQLARDRRPAPDRFAGPVTLEAAPSLAELGADQVDAYRTCGHCGMVCAAAMPALDDGALVLLEAEAGLFDMLAVQDGDRWCVRPVVELVEQGLPFWNRRRSHTCRVYPGRCQTPGHEDRPGRLSAGGMFCDLCGASRAQPAV